MTAPVMNSMNPPMMPGLPYVPDNTMVNAGMPVAPAISAVPAVPAAPVENNIPAQDSFVNSAVQAPAAAPVPATPPAASIAPAEDIWAKEINPGIPTGHAENTPQNVAASHEPAAAQLQQPKKSSWLKKILTLGIIAALGGLAYVKRKELPGIANNISNRLKNFKLKDLNFDKSPKKFWQDWSSVTTPERLEEYAQECFQAANPKFKQIKIHSATLKKEQRMSSVINSVMQVASDAMTAEKKGKRPVVHIVLKPEHKDKAVKIREWLNTKSISNFNEKQKRLLDEAVEKIEMKMESEQLADKLFLGKNTVMLNVGYPRSIDTKETLLNKASSYFTNNIKSKIPKYEK